MDNLKRKIVEKNNMNKDDKHKNLKKSMEMKQPIQMDDEELLYATTPIGKIHMTTQKLPEEKKKYKYVECEICGKTYCTNNTGKHKKTQYHIIHSNLNKKLKKILLNQ